MTSSKDLGAVAEMRFAIEAKMRGISVSKPICDNQPFDFIVHYKRFLKIQVKSNSQSIGKYKFKVTHGASTMKKYTNEEVDYFALYLGELDIFYIMPIEVVTCKQLTLNPYGVSKYNDYVNAFELLLE